MIYKNIETIEGILPTSVNNTIIEALLQQKDWRLGRDNTTVVEHREHILSNAGSDFGFIITSYDKWNNINIPSVLNVYAFLIYEIIKEKTKSKFIEPYRFLWNYYNKSSETALHQDMYDGGRWRSFVYSLNTCDGGTAVLDEFVKAESGKAMVFDSLLEHRGTKLINDSVRFNLNCIVKV